VEIEPGGDRPFIRVV